jgi:hypothetical protein
VDDQDDDRSARAPEPDDVLRICRALNELGARYLLIGGFAVIAHGAGRFTKDIDLLADNAAAEIADDDVQRHAVVRVADEVIVDLMGRACGLSYAEAARDAETIEREGVPIPLASPATLIRTKDTHRPQDALDRAFLEGVLRERAGRPGRN